MGVLDLRFLRVLLTDSFLAWSAAENVAAALSPEPSLARPCSVPILHELSAGWEGSAAGQKKRGFLRLEA
jgi:hypothetical protein